MKVRQRQSFAPINVIPGDTLSVVYRDDDGAETLLVRDTFTAPLVVDEALIVELNALEAAGLGLEKAVGGIIGKRA